MDKLEKILKQAKYTDYELMKILWDKNNDVIEWVNGIETSDNGKVSTSDFNTLDKLNYMGKWQGLDPVQSEQGMSALVGQHTGQINGLLTKTSDLLVSVKDFGAVTNDPLFDNTNAIQQAIDYVNQNGGGTVYFPKGIYYIKNTIDLKAFVILQGVSHNHLDNTDFGSVIKYSGTTNIDMITAIKTVDEQYYRWGCKIRQLQISGNNYADGIHLLSCAYTEFDDVSIEFCDKGLIIEGGMLDHYDNVNIRYCVSYGLFIPYNNHYTTTQVFNRLYCGQHRLNNAYPIYIAEHSGTDFTFNNLVIESNNKACYFGKAINVKFNDLYIENCPLNDTYVMKFGMHDVADGNPELNNYGGIYSITGLRATGLPTNWNTTSLFLLYNADEFSLSNAWLSHFKDIVVRDVSCTCQPIIMNSETENGLFTNKFDSLVSYANIFNCRQDGTKIINSLPVTNYTVSLLNSWANFGSGYKDFKVTKNASNMVNIEGTIKSGTTNIICNLPAELRPSSIVMAVGFAVISSAWTPVPITIGTTGDVTSLASGTGLNTALNIKYQL